MTSVHLQTESFQKTDMSEQRNTSLVLYSGSFPLSTHEKEPGLILRRTSRVKVYLLKINFEDSDAQCMLTRVESIAEDNGAYLILCLVPRFISSFHVGG